MLENNFNDLEKRLRNLEHENISHLSEKEVYKKAFQENLKLMKNLLDNAGFGTILFDKEERIIHVNEMLCKLTNYSSQELLKQKVGDLFREQQNLRQFLANAQYSTRTEDIVIRKDGSNLFSKCIFAPNLNINGNVTGYYALIEDITEQKKDEEKLKIERTYFKHLFDDSPEALAIINPEGKITNINTTFSKLFRYSPEDCFLKDINLLLPDKNYLAESEEFLRNTFNNKRQYIETIRKRNDDILIDVSITSTPITLDKNTKMAYLMFLNISERKKAERELKEAKIKAEESDRLKSSFLANLSHEIRTPMNAIVGFSSLISEPNRLSVEQKKRYSKNILNSCDNLVKLIDNIIDISKIEASQFQLYKDHFDLTSLLEELYIMFGKKINELNNKKITIQKDFDPDSRISIYTDESRLKQILYNLLDNAMKYTLEGHIRYGFKIETKNVIQFYVEDTGIGIDKIDHEKIFKRFIKIENNPNRLFSGIGIGLYISKKLIEEMGGEIYVESQINKGSKFHFTLPIKEIGDKIIIKPGSEEKYQRQKLDLSNKKILIVEDTDSSYLYLESLLGSTNAKITWLKSGVEAIKLIVEQKTDFDIILLDIQLPDITGYDVAKIIRKNGLSTPIVAQTAYAFQDDKIKSIQAGCNKYLSKPIRQEDLFEILNQLLK